jgi:hypothetical protein
MGAAALATGALAFSAAPAMAATSGPAASNFSGSWDCAASSNTSQGCSDQSNYEYSSVPWEVAEAPRTCGIDINLNQLHGNPSGVAVEEDSLSHGAWAAWDLNASESTPTVFVPYGVSLDDANLTDGYDPAGPIGWANAVSDGFLTGCQGSIELADVATGAPSAILKFDNPFDGSNSSSCVPLDLEGSCDAPTPGGDNTIFTYTLSGVAG